MEARTKRRVEAFLRSGPEKPTHQQSMLMLEAADRPEQLIICGWEKLSAWVEAQEKDIAAGLRAAPWSPNPETPPKDRNAHALAATADNATAEDGLDRAILAEGKGRAAELYLAGYRDLEEFRRHRRRDIEAGRAEAPAAV
ncbi:MAG: hypothetical protein NXI28_19910 [bacterium]|nr:hypothetical protein [bacterium]